MQRMLLLSLAICGMLLAAPSASWAKNTLPIVTGKHWNNSTEKEKKAFLLGMGTIIKLEHAVQGDAPLPDNKSLIDSWCEGLKGMSLDEVRNALDTYYATHTDKLDRPVVEVMFVEIALPHVKAVGN